ncbi:MAG TPA: TonB-dependent receptor [Acidisarcina sp.]|nr:TonB-dependent receptor [Acidisarcina sp.]
MPQRLKLLLLVVWLLCAILLWCALPAVAQQRVSGVVVDRQGRPVAGVSIFTPSGLVATTDAGGNFSGPSGVPLRFAAPAFATATATFLPGDAPRVVLNAAGPQQSITVTAYRTPLPVAESPASVRILTSGALRQAAAFSLDDKLRQVAGVELFRRSSSRVANPTSQGISLRGLGSTAASRTLVVADDVPQNDPFGGWIHWQDLPTLSIQSVEVVRGGASGLYGSGAIGGVVNLIPVRPGRDALSFLASYGGQNTREAAALGQGTYKKWAALASGGLFRTDGFILVAPAVRGPVDTASNLNAENGLVDIEHQSATMRIFVRGNGLNEARNNGTPLQKNGTRLWRYAGGLDWSDSSGGTLGLRLYGSTEHFRQTFSAISPSRMQERLTRLAQTPASELGAVAHWQQTLGDRLVLVVGGEVRDVRAEDTETPFPSRLRTSVSARQRQSSSYIEALWTPKQWTLTAGARVDLFRNFDARQSPASNVPLPRLDEDVFDPRVGLLRRIGPRFALTASGFRAFRAPTPNELYRNGQVGQELTIANPMLRTERATGWEAGSQISFPAATVRASYFWTQVNRPITALTLSATPTAIVKQRENLGQIESRGVAVDFETAPRSWLSVGGGYQFADATVTQSRQQPQIEGKWIPQVPRNMATLQATLHSSRFGTLAAQARASGRQYDDDANHFLLHGFFRVDASLSRSFGGADSHRFEVFAGVENMLDRAIEVGRTPVLTLGTPVTGRIGLRVELPGR